MSALAELPLRQDLAVTGSVNQHGEIQAIGGVDEKIEGFFDICKARGLTGSQGVIIPQANVRHLMLRRNVVEACAAGLFAVYAVSAIEEGLALMTRRAAGQQGSGVRTAPTLREAPTDSSTTGCAPLLRSDGISSAKVRPRRRKSANRNFHIRTPSRLSTLRVAVPSASLRRSFARSHERSDA
jgi:hypothetical protein